MIEVTIEPTCYLLFLIVADHIDVVEMGIISGAIEIAPAEHLRDDISLFDFDDPRVWNTLAIRRRWRECRVGESQQRGPVTFRYLCVRERLAFVRLRVIERL